MLLPDRSISEWSIFYKDIFIFTTRVKIIGYKKGLVKAPLMSY